MGVAVYVVMVHGSLKVITVQASHGGCGGRVLMVLDRQAGRRSRHEILETQIRVSATTSATGEFEAAPPPPSPLPSLVI